MNTPLYAETKPSGEGSYVFETTSGFQSAKSSNLTSETTTFFRENNSKTNSFMRDIPKVPLGGIIKPRFVRLDSTPLDNKLSDSVIDVSKGSSNGEITPIRTLTAIKTPELNTLLTKTDGDSQNQEKVDNLASSPKLKRRRGSLWDSLKNLSQMHRKDSLSVDDSYTSTLENRRRRSTVDFSSTLMRQETQFKGDDNMKTIIKKPGTDFTLNHFKLLRKQIENEKLRLEKDIKEAVEEKEKKDNALNLSITSSRKWEKAKKNVLALARVKRLNDDLRLWGSSMPVNALSPERKDLKMFMPENQFEVSGVEKKHNKYMIYPHTRFGMIWPIIYLMIMMYTAFVTPYRIAFLDHLPLTWIIIEQVIDGLFFIDILVTLNSAIILEDGQVIDDRKKIFLQYLKGWLLMDIIAIIPFSYFVDPDRQGNDYNDLIKFVRLPRLYKLIRLARVFRVIRRAKKNKYFQNIQDSLQINVSSLRIINFLIVLILSVHVFACLWFFAARFYEFAPNTWVYELNLVDETNYSLYITSVYWVVSTLTTVGFGDIHAFNDLERLLSIFWIIIGVGFYSLNIGAMTSLLANKDTREGNLSAKLVLMDEFATETGLPKELRLKIKRTLEYNSLRNVFNQFERNEFFDEIPIDVKSEMAEVMHRGVINKLKFFKNKDRVFIATMVPLLQPLKVSKGEIIYRTGEYPINIYFIISGRVNIVVGAHMINLKTYVQGSYFGEIEMVNNTIRQSTIRAEMDCELLTLSRKAFLRLMEDFPNYQEELKLIAEERQLRIAEALRKIKQLLPISFSSKFWEKNRKFSLYDLDDFEKQKLHDIESDQQGLADNNFLVPPSKFSNTHQVSKKNSDRKESLGSKIEEEENEDDEEEVRLDIPRQILEDKRASGKLANLINEQELKEEENKIAKWITQMQNNKTGFSDSKSPVDQSPQLTHTQLQTKLLQAEGDSFKKRSILIVKGAAGPQNNDLPEVPLISPAGSKRDSNVSSSDNAHHSGQSDSEKLSKDSQNIKNRKSYFFKTNNNSDEASNLHKSTSIKSEKSNIIKPIGRIFNKIFDHSKQTEEKKKNEDLDGLEGCFEDKINVVEIPTNIIRNFSQKIIERSNSVEKVKVIEDRKAKQTLDQILSKRRSFVKKDSMRFEDERLKNTQIDETNNNGKSEIQPNMLRDFERSRSSLQYNALKSDDSRGADIDHSKRSDVINKVVVTHEANVKTRGRSQTSDVTKKDQFYGVYNRVLDQVKPKHDFQSTNSTTVNQQSLLSKLNEADAQNESIKLSRFSSLNKHNSTDEKDAQGSYKIKIHGPESMSNSAIQTNAVRQIAPNTLIDPIDEGSESSVSKSTKYEGRSFESERGRIQKFITMKNNPYREELNVAIQRKETTEDKNFKTMFNRPQLEEHVHDKNSLSSEESNTDDSDSSTVSSVEIEQEDVNTNRNSEVNRFEQKLGREVNVKDQEKVQDIILKSADSDFEQERKWKELIPLTSTDKVWNGKRLESENQMGGAIRPPLELDQEKSVEKDSSDINRIINPIRREKMTRRSKRGLNKYKTKYKKQTKNLKILVKGFKEMKKELTDMHKDMVSVQDRINNFEKIIDNLHNLMAQVMSKMKSSLNKEQKNDFKDSTMDKISTRGYTDETGSLMPLTSAYRDDQVTSTVYLPQKKTIVFSFQKPGLSHKKAIEDDSGAIEEKVMESKSKEVNADQESLLINDDNVEQTEDHHKSSEYKIIHSKPEAKPDDLKTFVGRVPRLKIPATGIDFQHSNKGEAYNSDDENEGLVYENPKL